LRRIDYYRGLLVNCCAQLRAGVPLEEQAFPYQV